MKANNRSDWGTGLANFRGIGILVVLVVVVALVSLRNSSFLSLANLNDIALDTAILAIVAVGEMMAMVTGGIDISVGAGIGFSGMVVAIIVSTHLSMSPVLAIVIGAGVGAVLGIINGVLVVKANINPIITTLATMSIFRGSTFIVNFSSSQGSWIGAGQLPESFKHIARGTLFHIPTLVLITVVVYLIFAYLMVHTKLGREMYAVGSNPDAARMVGINVNRIRFLPYLFTGVLVGICGVLWVSRYTSAQSNAATGFEFTVLTAVVVGGVNVAGGSGTVTGVLLGAILIGAINNALNVSRISPFWLLGINGFIILLAIVLDKMISNRSARLASERRKRD